MLIGYSFWGFLGPGVVDTPDGGRSHRRSLIDGLISRGHDIVFLQANRDRLEASTPIDGPFRWDDTFPIIDALFLEWRWPIKGRNTTACGTPAHTCDLHRQHDLLDRYTAQGIPTIIWDKDRHLPPGDPLDALGNVVVCEAALFPRSGAESLRFPADDRMLDNVDPVDLAGRPRDLGLVYVGNQYGRDEAFDRLFVPAARRYQHVVAGKWTHRQPSWADINFVGRVGFNQVEALHRRTLATICLVPDRYATVGQMTQRIFEAAMAGCVPLVPDVVQGHEYFTQPETVISDAQDVIRTVAWLRDIAGSAEHVDLIARCVTALHPFRLSTQLDTLDRLLGDLTTKTHPGPAEGQ